MRQSSHGEPPNSSRLGHTRGRPGRDERRDPMVSDDDQRWPAELESLRAEAQAAAAGVGDFLTAARAGRASLSPAEQLALSRESLKAMEAEAPGAVDEVVGDVTCRV